MKEWHNTVCLDFDGVIGVFPHTEPESPVEGAIEGIQRLLDAGWYIEIYSGGSKHPKRYDEMRRLLNFWGNGIVDDNPIQISFPKGKPTAKIYVDDRGMKFENWETLTPEALEAFRAWWQHPSSDK